MQQFIREILNLACLSGDTRIVDKCVSELNPRDLNYTTEFGSPLSAAASRGHAAVVSILLKAGADPNFRNSEGFSLLNVAVANCRLEVVELLLQYGADANVEDPFLGTIPLSYAATIPFYGTKSPRPKALEAAELLLKAGPDPLRRTRHGTEPNALQEAADLGFHEMVDLFSRYYPEEIMEYWCSQPV